MIDQNGASWMDAGQQEQFREICGMIDTIKSGRDFYRVMERINGGGYSVDVINAAREYKQCFNSAQYEPQNGPQDAAQTADGQTEAEVDEQRIYRAALALWGPEAQTLMAFEEMAELQKELCKAARGKDNREQIAEEIADVEIMLGQMKILHTCVAVSAEHKARKLERLADRMEAAAREEGRVVLGPGPGLHLERTEETARAASAERLAWEDMRAVIVKPDAAAEWEERMQAAGCEIVQLEPGAEINLGERISTEELIRKTVAETFKVWKQTAKDGGCIVLPPEEVAQDGPGEQTEGG